MDAKEKTESNNKHEDLEPESPGEVQPSEADNPQGEEDGSRETAESEDETDIASDNVEPEEKPSEKTEEAPAGQPFELKGVTGKDNMKEFPETLESRGSIGQLDSIFVVRKCQVTDIDKVIRVMEEWEAEEITPSFIPSSRGELLARMSPYFLVAEIGGTILGFIQGRVKKAESSRIVEEGREYLEVDAIYVPPEARGQEVGSRLLKGLVEKARENQVNHFLVNISTKNVERFSSFLRQHRFKPLNVQFYL